MKPKLAIVIGFLVAVAAVIWIAARRGSDPPKPTATSGPPVEITLEYSTEKKDWLETVVADFAKDHPNIKVTLVGKGSLEAEAAILDGTDKPVLWSPADSSTTNLLASDWQTRYARPPFEKPEPLLLTPLVFVVWEDRAKVLLDAAGGQVSWKAIHAAVVSPKGWPALGGKPTWGFVKLGQTDPNRSNSGVQALALMAMEFFGTQALTPEHMLDARFQEFVMETERAVPKFDASTGAFMTDMVRFGPSKYDIAVVYENLAVSELEHAQGRWGSLHIYYPPTTIWSDHPIAILDAPWVTPAQKVAAKTLVDFLRSPRVQGWALRFGFRPADPSVPIKTNDEQNPFKKSAAYGLSLELPPAANAPDGAVVRQLLMMWSRVVKKS